MTTLFESLKDVKNQNECYKYLGLPTISENSFSKASEIVEFAELFNLNVQCYGSTIRNKVILDWEDENRIYGSVDIGVNTYELILWKPHTLYEVIHVGSIEDLTFEEFHRFVNIYHNYRKENK